MLRIFVVSTLVTIAVNALGEQHLRGEPTPAGALATEASNAEKPDVSRSVDMQKTLINFMRRIGGDPRKRQEAALIDHKEFFFMNSGEIFVSFVIWLVLYALLASYYHRYILHYQPVDDIKHDKSMREDFEGYKDFHSGLWGCKTGHGITFWSFCCPGIRWADTMSKLDIHRFYPAFWFMTALYCISFIPWCTFICFAIVVGYMTYHRQEFRKKFEFHEQGGSTVYTDCLTYTFCMCCAVAQEARHVRRATIVGHPAIGPASPKLADREPTAGPST